MLLELIKDPTFTGMVGAGMGAYIRMKAQNQAMFMETMNGALQMNKEDNQNSNDAAQRSAPWLRAIIGIIIAVVAFGGLLIAPWQEWTTTVMEHTSIKQFGPFKWGGKLKPVTAEGFVIPPYLPSSVGLLTGFLFGAAGANVMSRIRR